MNIFPNVFWPNSLNHKLKISITKTHRKKKYHIFLIYNHVFLSGLSESSKKLSPFELLFGKTFFYLSAN